MRKIEKNLKREGYLVENYGYKSVSVDLDSLGKQLYNKIKAERFDTVSFVTHSMGALLVRSMVQYAAKDKEFPKLFRIVMLTPPNSGAEVADFWSSFELMRKMLGPNISNMKTDSNSYANKLPVPLNTEIGIIAGIRKNETGYNPFIKGDNDGRLTPDRTKLGVEKDFILVKGEHNALTQKKFVCQLIIEFLKFGEFRSKEL